MTNSHQLLIDLERHPISDPEYGTSCLENLRTTGALVLKGFLRQEVVTRLQEEAVAIRSEAFFCNQIHNVYLLEPDPDFTRNHVRNAEQISDKGCIPHDQVPGNSPLRIIYEWPEFRKFLEKVLEFPLHPYADTLSSININYYETGQQLGWHFDNASFAVTLMIQSPRSGGRFEYVQGSRNSAKGEHGYETVQKILEGTTRPKILEAEVGDLILFRGRDTLHRVSPVEEELPRVLVTLNFNTEPGISLSELARQTFFGRLQ